MSNKYKLMRNKVILLSPIIVLLIISNCSGKSGQNTKLEKNRVVLTQLNYDTNSRKETEKSKISNRIIDRDTFIVDTICAIYILPDSTERDELIKRFHGEDGYQEYVFDCDYYFGIILDELEKNGIKIIYSNCRYYSFKTKTMSMIADKKKMPEYRAIFLFNGLKAPKKTNWKEIKEDISNYYELGK